MSCSNNFKQIGIAIHNYHSAFQQLPIQGTGTQMPPGGGASTAQDGTGNPAMNLSFLVALTPFIEQQALWDEIAAQSVKRNGAVDLVLPNRWNPMGPAPWASAYIRCEANAVFCLPWTQKIA